MFITCAMSQVVPYLDKDGTRKRIALRPGKHNYTMLKPKTDPILEDTLRILRKHAKIKFDDMLPSDVEILKRKPAGVDPVDFLAERVLLKKNPAGRFVSKKKEKVTPDVKRNSAGSPKTSKSSRKAADSGKPWGIPDEEQDPSS